MTDLKQNEIVDLIIKQEKKLYIRQDPLPILRELVDDEFMEIGSSANVYDKKEAIRWLGCDDPSEINGMDFKATFLAVDIILLTYTSVTTSPQLVKPKQAKRSSIWRRAEGQWKIVFHQGTPIT